MERHGGWPAGDYFAGGFTLVQSLRQQFFDAGTGIILGKEILWFHLPYPNFLQLVVSVSESELFDRWCGHKWNNKHRQ